MAEGEKLDHSSQTHLLLNAVPVREGARDRGAKKGGDRINGTQQADLVLCSAATEKSDSNRVNHSRLLHPASARIEVTRFIKRQRRTASPREPVTCAKGTELANT